MGLAASQARFLGLTARKSNVEYQGQQINQARTALSNEVMNLYDKYNKLDVPIPPSKNDYVKQTYTLKDTPENYQISNYTKITSGEYQGYYNVLLDCQQEIPCARIYTASGPIITATKNNNEISELNLTIGSDVYTYDGTDKSTITRITNEDYDKYPGLSVIIEKQGYPDGTVFFMYTKDNLSYYTTENTLLTSDFDWDEATGKGRFNGSSYSFDYLGYQDSTKTVSAIASLGQESTGRLSSINILKCEDDPDLAGYQYSITTGQKDDEAGYEDAMNQYYYKKMLYEKEVETINKKTEKLQAEDKALELKLNQLDTEQNALSTEMDSVSKVIEDTIDSVFKTFNS